MSLCSNAATEKRSILLKICTSSGVSVGSIINMCLFLLQSVWQQLAAVQHFSTDICIKLSISQWLDAPWPLSTFSLSHCQLHKNCSTWTMCGRSVSDMLLLSPTCLEKDQQYSRCMYSKICTILYYVFYSCILQLYKYIYMWSIYTHWPLY